MPLYDCADLYNGKPRRWDQVSAESPGKAAILYARTADMRLGLVMGQRAVVVRAEGGLDEPHTVISLGSTPATYAAWLMG